MINIDLIKKKINADEEKSKVGFDELRKLTGEVERLSAENKKLSEIIGGISKSISGIGLVSSDEIEKRKSPSEINMDVMNMDDSYFLSVISGERFNAKGVPRSDVSMMFYEIGYNLSEISKSLFKHPSLFVNKITQGDDNYTIFASRLLNILPNKKECK